MTIFAIHAVQVYMACYMRSLPLLAFAAKIKILVDNKKLENIMTCFLARKRFKMPMSKLLVILNGVNQGNLFMNVTLTPYRIYFFG